MKRLVHHFLLFSVCLGLAYGHTWPAKATQHEEMDPAVAHQAAVDTAHGAADAAHGAEHGGGGVGLPQFDPSSFPSQVFWLAVMFGVLYIFFSKKTLPDISGVLQKREGYIRDLLDTAKAQKEQAEKLQQDYESRLESARQAATGAYTEAEQAIKARAEKEHKAFQERAAKQTEKAEKEINHAKAEAMEDMQSLAAEIASQAAEKIIGVETDLDQAKTVVRSLKAKAA